MNATTAKATTTDANATTDAKAETITRGFKYLWGTDAKGDHTSDMSKVVKLMSDYDQSEWTLGEWRDIANHGSRRRIGCCDNGFHMSNTPANAARFVYSANVLALVEAKGESDHQDSKSAHASMRVIAMWPSDVVNGLTSKDQTPTVPDDVRSAYDTATNAAYSTFNVASDNAGHIWRQETKPIKDAYSRAIEPAQQANDLAHKLASIRHTAAVETARAVYSADVANADAVFRQTTLGALTTRDQAEAVCKKTYDNAVNAARTIQDEALSAASEVYNAALSEANAGLTAGILAKFAKAKVNKPRLADGITLA